jgi:cell pole-organizing protein PopZ
MAQPSVAREPSMEEILASIRRIIESNEPGPSGAFAGKLPPVYDDESDDDFGIAFTQAGNPASSAERRGEMTSPPPHVPPAANQTHGAAAQPVPEKAMSLADVAARVRAATGRTLEPALSALTAETLQDKPEAKPVAAHAAYESPVMAARMAELRGSIDDTAAEISRPSQPFFSEERQATISPFPVRETPAVQSAPAVAWDEETFEQALELADVHEASAPVVNPAPVAETVQFVEPVAEPVAEAPSALSSLISVEAGAQIARSFNELADVFNGVERRSIEDMAQEMLKPMLQDWLEDNLPTLVERLVREEIERVARGPRR